MNHAIESGTEWTFNQSYEFKVMNSLSTPRSKTKDEHYWYFVLCIKIKENEHTYAKLKWETRRMGWCWFPWLNVYGMTLVFFLLVLNYFSVEWKLFSKVCDPLFLKLLHWSRYRHVTWTTKECDKAIGMWKNNRIYGTFVRKVTNGIHLLKLEWIELDRPCKFPLNILSLRSSLCLPQLIAWGLKWSRCTSLTQRLVTL
jgi:hypothetical protein